MTSTLSLKKSVLPIDAPAKQRPLIAIDAPSTRDVDDAIGLAKDGDGWVATVVIADAAAHVPIGGTEDDAARRQGATIYHGQRAVQTMLKRSIAEDVASLTAGKRRRLVQVDLAIDAQLGVTLVNLSRRERAIDAHVPYTELAARARVADDPLSPTLQEMVEVSQRLLQARRAHGALAYYDLKRLLFLDEEGRLQHAESRDVAIGQILVQEFMILANAALANWAVSHNVPVLFRNHAANAAAPNAVDLAATVQSWLSAGAAAEDTARDQLNLILGVAHYHPQLHGHYALNLPAYAHTTSPLRRYADLVVQRQITAALDGESLPYSRSDLTGLAEELNQTLAARKEERKAGFKETVVRRATRAMERDQFATLSDPDLSQALKIADGLQRYPEGLIETICQRILESTLTDKVFDRLLEAQPGSLPPAIAEAWRTFLLSAPERAKHLLMHGEQVGMYAQYQADEESLAGGAFRIEATIRRVSQGDTVRASAVASRKRDAENAAAARLVMRCMGIPVEDLAAPAAADTTAATGTASNFKGALQERCQKGRWPMPRYESSSTGPTNAAVFESTVTVITPAGQIVGRAAGARTRIEAEHRAAEAALAKLPLPAHKGVATRAEDNPVGWLQERCQKIGAEPPQYRFEGGAGGFLCRVSSIILPNGPYVGEGTSQADAKRAAARNAVEHCLRCDASKAQPAD